MRLVMAPTAMAIQARLQVPGASSGSGSISGEVAGSGSVPGSGAAGLDSSFRFRVAICDEAPVVNMVPLIPSLLLLAMP